MSKVSKRPSVAMPALQEDKAIAAAAKADPDAQPLTPKQLKSMFQCEPCEDAPSLRRRSNSCQCDIAWRSWSISRPPEKVGSPVWIACCATMSRATPVEREAGAEPDGQPDLCKMPRKPVTFTLSCKVSMSPASLYLRTTPNCRTAMREALHDVHRSRLEHGRLLSGTVQVCHATGTSLRIEALNAEP